MVRHAELADLKLPEFGMPTIEPDIPAETYRARMSELCRRAGEERYDHVAVYADREHFANLAYLTGYDPRFEEALLLVNVGGARAHHPDENRSHRNELGEGDISSIPYNKEDQIRK